MLVMNRNREQKRKNVGIRPLTAARRTKYGDGMATAVILLALELQ